MGASSSKLEEDKALKLCRERKKFVRQALDGRCSLAAAHVAYVESLRNTGTSLRNFVKPDATAEPSLYTSTSAMPETLALTERALSQFSHASRSTSQCIDTAENVVPSPSPTKSMKFQVSHMKFRGGFSKKIEEKPSVPITGTVTSSSTPQNDPPPSMGNETQAVDDSVSPPTPPWDYFGLFHPIDHQFSFQDGKGMQQDFDNGDNIRQLREEEGIPELEDDEEKVSFHGKDVSDISEDEFDEPSSDTLVRSFQNRNRVQDQSTPNASPTMGTHSTRKVPPESKSAKQEKHGSPNLSPLKAVPDLSPSKAVPDLSPLEQPPDLSPLTTTSSAFPLQSKNQKSQENDGPLENKVFAKDFFSSMEDIESLFLEASESGKEVPRMLEANKLHFRPIFPGKESGPKASMLLKACFSCGEDPVEVREEPAQNSIKYLTWHRTESSRSSSSRNPLGANSRDDMEDFTNNLFDNFCMNSGSHASTLDRLYAWERKLYDEVKASELVRRQYDLKCKILRHLESKGESTHKIDKTRAAVKDLYSRIIIAIHRIDSISKRIEELRDKELQPQLEELIGGLSRMWNVMSKCHKLQFEIISIAMRNEQNRITRQSEVLRQTTAYLENELHTFSSSFTKWIGSQKFYVESINGWLSKCIIDDQKSSKRKRRNWDTPLRLVGPPIYATCRVWLQKLDGLPTKDVTDSIKALAADAASFIPSQEKTRGKDGRKAPENVVGESSANLLQDEGPEDFASGFDRFQSNLVRFLGQLSKFAECSVKMYEDIDKEIQDAKRVYGEWKSQSFKST